MYRNRKDFFMPAENGSRRTINAVGRAVQPAQIREPLQYYIEQHNCQRGTAYMKCCVFFNTSGTPYLALPHMMGGVQLDDDRRDAFTNAGMPKFRIANIAATQSATKNIIDLWSRKPRTPMAKIDYLVRVAHCDGYADAKKQEYIFNGK